MNIELSTHALRREAICAQLRCNQVAAPLGLNKPSSNLFRDRLEGNKQRLDMSDFCHVLEVNTAQGWVDVEGMASYEQIVAQTLRHGVMPAVVPQLKTITAGGAAAGVGIEATSHRCGLVHHTLLEIDVLLPSGEVVHCTPDNEHRDLYFGFPNSYGTLGYALRLRLRTLPVKPYVRVEHFVYSDPVEFFGELATRCRNGVNFIDGVVFSGQQQVLNVASFVDSATWLSDYSFKEIYYRSLLERPLDYMRVQDYIWRWDTDWFWCSKNLGAQHPVVRRLLGRSHLNSRTYTRLMRWSERWKLQGRLERWRGLYGESVIQDVDVPLSAAAGFLDFLQREIGIMPVWICPVRALGTDARFTLYPMAPDSLYVNFGFWDRIESRVAHEPGHLNRLIEREVTRLGGIKSLYSESYFTPDEFARAYAMDQYQVLKQKYDPQERMLGLYQKCVLRA